MAVRDFLFYNYAVSPVRFGVIQRRVGAFQKGLGRVTGIKASDAKTGCDAQILVERAVFDLNAQVVRFETRRC